MMLLDIAIAIVLAWVTARSGIDDEITDSLNEDEQATGGSNGDDILH